MWLTDNPWPPIVILGMGAVVCAAAWYPRKNAKFLVAAAALCLAAVGVYFVEGMILTEEEQVEAQVLGVTDAFRRQDLEGTLAFFSPRAEAERSLVRQAEAVIDEVHSLRITDMSVELLAENTRAKSHFRANGEVSVSAAGLSHRNRFTTRWRLTWQKEADQWKVIEVHRLHPIRGDEIGPLDAK